VEANIMSDVTTPETNRDWEDADDVSWNLLDLDELVDAYWAIVAPVMETDELDPKQEKPTHSWLRDHGFRPLFYALREYHNRTFAEFWREDLEFNAVDRATTGQPTTNGRPRHSSPSSRHSESARALQTRQSIPSATD
jgi:hypothetical protein